MNAAARKASPAHTKATIARYDVSAASCAEEDARLQQEQELLDQFFAGDSAVQGGGDQRGVTQRPKSLKRLRTEPAADAGESSRHCLPDPRDREPERRTTHRSASKKP